MNNDHQDHMREYDFPIEDAADETPESLVFELNGIRVEFLDVEEINIQPAPLC